jgi:uncharacterized membrane protein
MTSPATLSQTFAPGTTGQARLIYWGLLLGLVLPGVNVVAAGFAWHARARGDERVRSHHANQISIFWRSVVYVLIGLALTWFLFGVLLIIATIIWYILRVLKGLKALSACLPPENPQSWLF